MYKPRRCLVGAGGGVGTNIGGGVVGGDWAGAKEPRPWVPLEVSAGVDCPLDVGVGYGCEGGRGVLFAIECAGVEAPELLSINVGVLCPPLDDGANDVGGGVEVFTMGSTGEEGIAPGDRLEGLGVTYVGISSVSRG
jgi:hypothetical protein